MLTTEFVRQLLEEYEDEQFWSRGLIDKDDLAGYLAGNIAKRLSEGVVWKKALTVLEGEFTKAPMLVDDKGYRYYPWWMGTELGVGERIEVTVKIVGGRRMQEKIEKIIRETLFLWNEPDDPKEWVLDGFKGAATEIIKLITAEITTLFDADKYDALQVQDATWKDIEGELAAALATAQAQVAVMAEAITDVIECRGRGDAWLGERLRQALSAAPKVVWSAKALVIGWDGAYKELLIEKADLTFITGTENIDKYVGRGAQVIVLDKGEGE